MKIELTERHVRIETDERDKDNGGYKWRCFDRSDASALDQYAEAVEREIGWLLVRERPNSCATRYP